MRHNGSYVAVLNSNGLYIPQRCVGVDGDLRRNPQLVLQSLDQDPNHTNVNLDNVNLTMDKPEVGMANIVCNRTNKRMALWCAGAAHRQIKRSLNLNMLDRKLIGELHDMVSVQANFGVEGREGRANTRSALMSWFNNEYPTIAIAISDIMSGEAYSVAFSRKFALLALSTGGIGLYYKTTLVGYIDDDNSPVLFPNNTFLRESLEEELC
jgi:hypothetical protein